MNKKCNCNIQAMTILYYPSHPVVPAGGEVHVPEVPVPVLEVMLHVTEGRSAWTMFEILEARNWP